MTESGSAPRNPFALPLRDYDVNPYIHPVEARSGRGGRLVSAAGREYVDFMSAWGTNLLGYGHRGVARAVSRQIRRFASLGLPYPEFHELAELIRQIVPSAETVRYGKNGSDACSGAVRLARAITGREHVLYRGYHGFHDWYMASSDCAGIPAVLRTQIGSLESLDPEAVEKLLGGSPVKVAAVMINPLVGPYPSADDVRDVIEVVHAHGALMIFDEMMSGFRVANGGMQEVWGVEPDLSCFGKSIANGLPLSALVGKREHMAQLPATYYGMTFEGEAVSIAAAHATLRELIDRQVVAALYAKGRRIRGTFEELTRRHEVGGRLVGYEPCMHMEFDDHGPVGGRELLWLMLQELERHGVFTLGAFILSYSHGRRDLNHLFAALESSFAKLREAIDRGTTEDLLDEGVRRSLGTVRGPGQWRRQPAAGHEARSLEDLPQPVAETSNHVLKSWWDNVASSLEEAKSTSYAPDPVQLRLSGEHGDDNSPGARQLAVFGKVDSSSRVLEVGSGVGRIAKSFAPRVGEWVGADISARLIDFAREYTAEQDNVRFHETDGVSLDGLDSASFDFVYSTVVLAYMDKEDLFANLRAARRVLKPGCRAYFDTWNQLHPDTFRLWLASQRRNRGDGKDIGRLRCSSAAEFRHLIERAGFEILAFDEERLLRAWCRKPDAPELPGPDGVAPFGYVDSPSSGQDLVGPLTISGWALDEIERVDVLIDGVAPSASAEYGLERNDLVALFPDYAEAGRAGFALCLDPGTLVAGRHEIEVLATDARRRTTRLTGYHRSFTYRPSE
jgi:glutamate-1-semialdehyde aminotransferase/SAM-dependent methyltransferase